MRRLITVVILIAFNCIVILAQQTDKQSLRPKTRVPTDVPALNTPPDGASFQLLAPNFAFGKSQTTLTILPAAHSTKQGNPFVVLNGAVYMPVLGGRSLIPIPGGGASGCFSLDLPRRITNLEEFLPKLDALEQVKPKRY